MEEVLELRHHICDILANAYKYEELAYDDIDMMLKIGKILGDLEEKVKEL